MARLTTRSIPINDPTIIELMIELSVSYVIIVMICDDFNPIALNSPSSFNAYLMFA